MIWKYHYILMIKRKYMKQKIRIALKEIHQIWHITTWLFSLREVPSIFPRKVADSGWLQLLYWSLHQTQLSRNRVNQLLYHIDFVTFLWVPPPLYHPPDTVIYEQNKPVTLSYWFCNISIGWATFGPSTGHSYLGTELHTFIILIL